MLSKTDLSCNWACPTIYNLEDTGGYTTFAQNVPDAADSSLSYEDNLAFSYIHGKGTNDPGATWMRGPDRLRYGSTGRDFTVYVSIRL
jgi:hypothetical protein